MYPEYQELIDQAIAVLLLGVAGALVVFFKRLVNVAATWLETKTGSELFGDIMRNSAIDGFDRLEERVQHITADGVVTRDEYRQLITDIENVFIMKLRTAGKEATTYVEKLGGDIQPLARRYANELLDQWGIVIDDAGGAGVGAGVGSRDKNLN